MKNKILLVRETIGLVCLLALASCASTGQSPTYPAPAATQVNATPTYALATPYAQQPAAGICATFDGTVVTITINSDMPSPRCAKVRPDQTLTVVNTTLSTEQVSLGSFTSSILPGAEYSIAVPFGDYLAVGVHQLSVTPNFGAEVWLEAGK